MGCAGMRNYVFEDSTCKCQYMETYKKNAFLIFYQEEYPSTNQYGVGCPSQLLGHSVVDQLKLAGFNFDYKETQLIS